MRPSESGEWQLHGKYSTHPSYRTGHLTWLVLQCETLHGWHHNAKPSHLHWAQCEVLHTAHIFKSTTVHYAHMCSIHLRIRMMCGGNQGFADKGELKCNCILYWLCRFYWTGIESSNTLTCATLYMRNPTFPQILPSGWLWGGGGINPYGLPDHKIFIFFFGDFLKIFWAIWTGQAFRLWIEMIMISNSAEVKGGGVILQNPIEVCMMPDGERRQEDSWRIVNTCYLTNSIAVPPCTL